MLSAGLEMAGQPNCNSLDRFARQEDVRPRLLFLELQLFQVQFVDALGHPVDAVVAMAPGKRGNLQKSLAVLAVLQRVLQGVLRRVLAVHRQLILGGLLTRRQRGLVGIRRRRSAAGTLHAFRLRPAGPANRRKISQRSATPFCLAFCAPTYLEQMLSMPGLVMPLKLPLP